MESVLEQGVILAAFINLLSSCFSLTSNPPELSPPSELKGPQLNVPCADWMRTLPELRTCSLPRVIGKLPPPSSPLFKRW